MNFQKKPIKTENIYNSKSLHVFVALLKIYRPEIRGYNSVCKKYSVCKFPECIQSFKWVIDIRKHRHTHRHSYTSMLQSPINTHIYTNVETVLYFSL